MYYYCISNCAWEMLDVDSHIWSRLSKLSSRKETMELTTSRLQKGGIYERKRRTDSNELNAHTVEVDTYSYTKIKCEKSQKRRILRSNLISIPISSFFSTQIIKYIIFVMVAYIYIDIYGNNPIFFF